MRRALAIVVVVALVVLGVALAYRTKHVAVFTTPQGTVELDASGDLRLATATGRFTIVGREAQGTRAGSLRQIELAHAAILDGIAIGATVDGAPAKLVGLSLRPTPGAATHAAAEVVLEAGGRSIPAELGYTLVADPPALIVSLASRASAPAWLGLVLTTPMEGRRVFVRAIGSIADATDGRGPAIFFEQPGHVGAIGSLEADVAVHVATAGDEVGAPELLVTALGLEAPKGSLARMFVLAAESPERAAEAASRLRGEALRTIRGRVVGAGANVEVWAVGSDQRPVLHLIPGPDGRFEARAPSVPLGLYATSADMRASAIVTRAPEDGADVELTVVPGGEVRVRVEDKDTAEPLTSRLVVHGVPPTADPNFGPDYRASGAGPLLDALRGGASITLPTGRYRVLATRGPEYTIDERTIDVPPGGNQTLALALRHVVDTPDLVGCDFHVHARPSFDSQVLPEDRVLSLVAAGVEFAVPSEHNAIGDYAPALEAQGLAKDLGTVKGVEITTVDPRRGHFNVFPFDDPEPPPYRQKPLKEIFAKARNGDAARVLQVNHPRLSHGIGYFDLVGLDTKTGKTERGEYRSEYDTLEVYNGVEAADRSKVELVMRDWLRLLERGRKYVATGDSDSHRIQFGWAGYPRTYVSLAPEKAGSSAGTMDTAALVASLKAGHVVVTSGPLIEARIGAAGPGDTAPAREGRARVHVRVRAAPWIDVTEIEVLVGTTSVAKLPVASRPLSVGAAEGSLDDARAVAIRFEGDVDLPDVAKASFVVVVARGTRAMDDVLPYMPIQPFAFTNPIWLER